MTYDFTENTATIKEIMGTQFGDYVLCTVEPSPHTAGCKFMARMAGSDEYLSAHPTHKDALAAIKRYQAGDARRRRA